MKNLLRIGSLILAGFGLLTVSVAAAQTSNSYPELTVEKRLQTLETQVQSLENYQPCTTSCECEVLPSVCGDSRRGGFYAGFACVIAKPHFKEAFQAAMFTGPGQLTMVPFEYGFDVAPRAWFGFKADNGLGVRTRYWQYNQSADPFQSPPGITAMAQVVSIIYPATIIAIPPAVLDVADELEVQTVDLEGTQDIQIGKVSMVACGGLRYALMRQQSNATVTNSGVVQQSLSWQRRFEGVGPTIGVEVERPLGTCGLAFVGVFRGSLLFGDKDLDRVEFNGSGSGPPIITLDKASEVLGIGEIELGLQWTRQLDRCGEFTVRGTYEGQLWSDSGSPTLGYLGFEGFGIACGFSR